jgi:hypothetical protein
MPVNYPKFDKKIQDQIDLTLSQKQKTRPGIVMSFDSVNNTATVILDGHDTETMGSVVRGVPCPLVKGVQSVAPTIGTRCLVAFRDSNESSPYILSFFEDTTVNPSNIRNYTVKTGIPRFMVH